MEQAGDDSAATPFEQYRSYLRLLAGLHLDARLRARVEPSDIVQQTLLEAFACRERAPSSPDERAAWLRAILANNLRDARRRWRRQKRDIARERSLDEPLAESSQRIERMLAADQTSPSRQAIRHEDLLRLADALWTLPESQRIAITLHHLQGCTLASAAAQMGKTEGAVAGLLHRGLRSLRERLES
ncbi:MAG: sigma-70 family RNA polymerase sigma factor [Pirellulales bacterium]